MSEADAQPVSQSAKKPFDVSLVFAICGVLFSLLIFLFMLKQERESVIQQFNAEMSQKVADFQHGFSNSLQKLHSLNAVLSIVPVTQGIFQEQVTPTVNSSALIQTAFWLPANAVDQLISVDGTQSEYIKSEPIRVWLQSSVQSQQEMNTVVELDSGAVLLVSLPTITKGKLIAVIGIKEMVKHSQFGTVSDDVSLKILLSDGRQLFSSGEGVVAEDAIFAQKLGGGLPWTFSFAASEDYISDKMSFLPGLFLLMGLLLSFMFASYLKKLQKNLNVLREEQEILEQQVVDSNWNDPLTGLANRILFDDALDIECRRAVREFSPLSLMVVEIDYYSDLVESYGQQGAEVTLQQVASGLQSCVTRPGDLIARTDEQQFAFILPSTNEMVIHLAARCLDAVKELQLPSDTSPIADVVTVSIGLVTLQPSKNMTPERLFEGAFEQLLQARNNGGDQYMSFAEHGLEPSITYSV
ncbi:MAG: diguanylate cyclase domain-containing protein [Neptuniibacter sp.]